jgi:hypothetical protein
MRFAALLDGIHISNIVILADGAEGDAALDDFDNAVEITGMDPMPALGLGWTFVDGVFVPPPVPPLTWDDIRRERDSLLAASDWTQVADAPLTASEKQAWADYRQALRDVPQDFDSPDDVIWPEAP